MRKRFLILLSLFLFNLGTNAHNENCPHIQCLTVSPSMPNLCEEFNFYSKIMTGGATITGVIVTWDFGDGSAPVSTNYGSLGTMSIIYPATTYVYSLPGVYTATLTVVGWDGTYYCVDKQVVTVTVTGMCEPCTTQTVLSTDQNWFVLRSYNLSPPTFTPIPNTVVNYSSLSAITSATNCSSPPLGQSRPITAPSIGSAPNIYTFRRSFTLPAVTPGNMFSLVMNLKASDYIFDVQLNGVSVMTSGQPANLQLNLSSCSGLMLTGVNVLDVTVANINGNLDLDVEAIVYDCPCTIPCSGGAGWNYSYSWNTNWGYGWYYYWSLWYCVTYGPLPGGTCPPPGGPGGGSCPSCTPGGGGSGTSGGWSWVYVSGWGWMWVNGSSSGTINISCPNCIASFAPVPGKRYLLSAWVKEKNAPQSKTSYTYPAVTILFPSISGSAGPFLPSGNIIDGWQRIEAEFTIPGLASNMTVKLDCTSSDCYYDDIRILPFDGSMKSYVYDPVNMRLVAELDERNFATLYEYDEEGKLIRVKKETEKGKMTLKENRDNTKK